MKAVNLFILIFSITLFGCSEKAKQKDDNIHKEVVEVKREATKLKFRKFKKYYKKHKIEIYYNLDFPVNNEKVKQTLFSKIFEERTYTKDIQLVIDDIFKEKTSHYIKKPPYKFQKTGNGTFLNKQVLCYDVNSFESAPNNFSFYELIKIDVETGKIIKANEVFKDLNSENLQKMILLKCKSQLDILQQNLKFKML